MTYSPLLLRGLSLKTATHTDSALLELENGLNVICGASDTGKSFIVEMIDFLLGSSSPLRDIPELVQYDRACLALQDEGEEPFTIERDKRGGGFRKFDGIWLSNIPNSNGTILRDRHSQGRDDTLSNKLLTILGLDNKVVQKNRGGETRSLSFRDLAKLVVVQEEEITKRHSPFLSGQFTQKTVEQSVFRLLVTGTDDSALVSQSGTTVTQADNRAKIELLEDLLGSWNAELAELNERNVSRTYAEDSLCELEERTTQQQQILNQIQNELNNRIEARREAARELSYISDRFDEIGALLARFQLLQESYQVDLERLSSIEESGSLFVYLERIPCPLCGALPEDRHQEDDCDGDIPSVVTAATAEISKIQKLMLELNETIDDLREESEDLVIRKQESSNHLRLINDDIHATFSPAFTENQNIVNDLLSQANSMRQIIDLYSKIEQLEEKKQSFFEHEQESSNAPVILSPAPSASVLDAFAEKVQQLLEEWGFPGSGRVHFDPQTFDLIIDGQPRASRGKGLRAITHAAMTIGLLDFCRTNNLSHPGFVVLDSPLLAYWAPENADDSLAGTDLKNRFYEYLSHNYGDSQIVIVENEHPPFNLHDQIKLTVFTKNPNEGRYGFIPL